VIVLTDPYSGWEVLKLEWQGRCCGILYNPLSTARPVPWSSSCDHCQRPTRRDLKASLRRHVQLLASERVITRAVSVYDVPVLHRDRATVQISRIPNGVEAVVESRSGSLVVTKHKHEPRRYEGDRSLLSKIVHRELELLLSARPASPSHVRNCARHLASGKSTSGPCRQIDWEAICDELGSREARSC
jgi:hypothetical protein